MNHDVFRQICERRYEYAAGIDLLDWDLYRSIFTDEIEVCVMSTVTQPRPEPRRMAADAWVARVASLIGGFVATQHCMYNPRADIGDDTATLTMYMQAEHFLDFEQPDTSYTIGGYYRDRLVRGSEGWKIEGLSLTLFWQRGTEAALAEARRRAASGPVPRPPAAAR